MFDVAIIGAGLAGASCADSLVKRGKKVVVIEKKDTPAASASNNHDAILSRHISDRDSDPQRIYQEGFLYSQMFLKQFQEKTKVQCFSVTGAFQFKTTPRLESVFENLNISGEKTHLEDTCVVDMPKLVRELLNSALITQMYNCEVKSIEKNKDEWSLKDSNGGTIVNVPHVVIASAYEAKKLSQLQEIPLEPVRGEVWMIPEEFLVNPLNSVLLFGGYLTPPSKGYVTLGGSFRHNDLSVESNEDELQKLFKELSQWSPGLLNIEALGNAKSRVCFRTSTFDRFPYVGALPNFQSIQDEISKYRSGTDLKKKIPALSYPGLWISLGHGSKGMTTCLMTGEMIAQAINGEEQKFESFSKLNSMRLVSRALHP